jgi:hypothetical protein
LRGIFVVGKGYFKTSTIRFVEPSLETIFIIIDIVKKKKANKMKFKKRKNSLK